MTTKHILAIDEIDGIINFAEYKEDMDALYIVHISDSKYSTDIDIHKSIELVEIHISKQNSHRRLKVHDCNLQIKKNNQHYELLTTINDLIFQSISFKDSAITTELVQKINVIFDYIETTKNRIDEFIDEFGYSDILNSNYSKYH